MNQKEQEILELQKPWEQRIREQQERDEAEKKRNEDNKRAPHLTNLNEDIQLSGKMYYSLKDCLTAPLHIGRHDGDPAPQIVLRGVGIQTNHAQIVMMPTGHFKLLVIGKEAFEQTLLNGKRLHPEPQKLDEDEDL